MDGFLQSGEASFAGMVFDSTGDAYYVTSGLSDNVLVKRELSTGKRWVIAQNLGTVNDVAIYSNTIYLAIYSGQMQPISTAGVLGTPFTVGSCPLLRNVDFDASGNMYVGCDTYVNGGFTGSLVKTTLANPGSATVIVSNAAWQAFETASNNMGDGFRALSVYANSYVYVLDFWGGVPAQRFTLTGTAIPLLNTWEIWQVRMPAGQASQPIQRTATFIPIGIPRGLPS